MEELLPTLPEPTLLSSSFSSITSVVMGLGDEPEAEATGGVVSSNRIVSSHLDNGFHLGSNCSQ